MNRINHARLIPELRQDPGVLKQRMAMRHIHGIHVGLQQALRLLLMRYGTAWIEDAKRRRMIAKNPKPVLAYQFRLALWQPGTDKPNLVTLLAQILCFLKCQAIGATGIVRVVVACRNENTLTTHRVAYRCGCCFKRWMIKTTLSATKNVLIKAGK